MDNSNFDWPRRQGPRSGDFESLFSGHTPTVPLTSNPAYPYIPRDQPMPVVKRYSPEKTEPKCQNGSERNRYIDLFIKTAEFARFEVEGDHHGAFAPKCLI